MYLDYFGMRELPFTLTPNTGFFIDLDGHHQALEVIQRALASGEDFIAITGEVGTGKTLLCRRLLNTFGDEVVSAYLPKPFLTPDGLLLALAEELDLPVTPDQDRHHLLDRIGASLVEIRKAGKQVVFLLDEAQAMPEESIEALRLLTSLETETEKLLQVVLFGQPELNDLLDRDPLRQLKQHITFSYALPVLNHEEVTNYINHRLSLSGFTGANLFSPQAIDDLFKASAGIPRLINILCHKALLVAYGRGDASVSQLHVSRAIEDTEDVSRIDRRFEQLKDKSHAHWTSLMLVGVAGSGLALLGVYLLGP